MGLFRNLLKRKRQVWVLAINHEHGTDHSVHSTYEELEETLYEYVKEYWDEFMQDSEGSAPDIGEFSRGEAIEKYYETAGERLFCEEWYETALCTVLL